MNTNGLLNKIKNYKAKNRLEEMGASRDLEIVVQKLEKGEYEKGFVNSNKFDIGTRTEGLFREIEFLLQLGHDWEKLLEVLNIEKHEKIVDICPGFTPKIELGLYFRQFKGKIYILDIDSKSINSLTRFIKLFNPQFKVLKKKENLFGKKISVFDLVLGNHIIDDLVVYYFTNKAGISLKDFYAKEEVAISVWKNILKSKSANVNDVSEKIADILERITRDRGTVCLSQYKSYAEKLFGLSEAYTFNKEVFGKVKSILVGRGFRTDDKVISKAFRNYKGHFGKKDCAILQKYEHKSKKSR